MRRTWGKSFHIIFIICFCIVGWSLLAEAIAKRQVDEKESGLIRLHVLANSDSPADQRLKLAVRDAILRDLAPKLEMVKRREDARQIIVENQARLLLLAKETLLKNGSADPVQIELGAFDFPLKTYGDVVVPAGRYEAVRVLIGEAEGANWWCVLFPPLCFIDESKVVYPAQNGEAQNQTQAAKTSVEFRFKIAELLSNLQ